MRKGIRHIPLPNPPVGPTAASLPVSAHGFPVCFDMECDQVAKASGLWPAKRIVVGSIFFMLKADEKEAVLAHEAKHCLGLHMEKRIAWLPVSAVLILLLWVGERLMALAAWGLRRITHRHEFEADAYAAAQGYGPAMLRFLKRFGHAMPTDPFYPTRDERILNLDRIFKEKAHEAAA